MLDGYKWMSLHNLGSVTKQGRPVEKWYISTHQSGFRVWDIENFSSTDERLCPRSTDKDLGDTYKVERYFKNNDAKWSMRFDDK
jgi:hypothetical protein